MATDLLTCCSRQDDTKYRHWCYCPIATVIAKSVEKLAVMCGAHGFDGTYDPQTFYKTKVVTGEVNRYLDGPKVDTITYERDEEGNCGSSVETVGSENEPDDNITGQSGTHGVEYSDPDTEADALDAATATVGGSRSSRYATRNFTNPNFTKRTVDYCVLCTYLVKGKSYNGKIRKRSRVAVGGLGATWVDEESDTFTITAAVGASRTHNKFHIEGGTLNESITPQEFIDERYSLDPTDYGLAESEDVITPATELDHIQGYEYEIAPFDYSVDLDRVYVEADA